MTDFLQEFIQSESERLNILHEARWIEEFVLREANDINSQKELCESVFRRRAQGEPLAYIFGSWAFREYEFFVGPGVLIPRPETEELVEYALDAIRGSALWKNLQKPTSPILRVCDLGAGTGCVGLSFAYDVLKKSPSNLQVELFLVERSPEAKEYLKKNIALFTSSSHLEKHFASRSETLSLSKRLKIHLIESDWDCLQSYVLGADLSEGFHVLLSNPPYLTEDEWRAADSSVKDYEPKQALVPERDPLKAFSPYAELLEIANLHLHREGFFLAEWGIVQPKYFNEIVARLKSEFGAEILQDMSGKKRFLKIFHGNL